VNKVRVIPTKVGIQSQNFLRPKSLDWIPGQARNDMLRNILKEQGMSIIVAPLKVVEEIATSHPDFIGVILAMTALSIILVLN